MDEWKDLTQTERTLYLVELVAIRDMYKVAPRTMDHFCTHRKGLLRSRDYVRIYHDLFVAKVLLFRKAKSVGSANQIWVEAVAILQSLPIQPTDYQIRQAVKNHQM